MTKTIRTISVVGIAAVLAVGLSVLSASVIAADTDISGVVTSAVGPEAGVWVIAETLDFDTKFRKIVVTNDDGRFLVPDLQAANYDVWVRGYGLVDSERTTA
ncbi:uncharacterized protein METZ01_LOCUS395058, partial [marine metagenome]